MIRVSWTEPTYSEFVAGHVHVIIVDEPIEAVQSFADQLHRQGKVNVKVEEV